MPTPTCLFYTAANDELRHHAARLLAYGTVDLGSVTSDPSAFLEEVQAHQPDLVVVDLGAEPEAVLDLLDKLPEPRPGLLVIGPRDDSRAILRAMRMGVREYFDTSPGEDGLRRAIDRVAAQILPEVTAPSRPARVVAVMGAKGGVGATVVACQLAASLRAGGARTAVVDLNLPLGDVSLHFDVQPAYTLAHIARESERLDATYLRTLLQGPAGGVQILAAPSHAEEAELVRGSHVERVLNLLKEDFDWVILDVSRTWSEPTVRALDLADRILLVTLMDIPTLHHTRQHIDLLERLGHSGRRLRLILNRYSGSDSVTDKDVSEFLDREADFRIPNDYPTTLAALNRGLSVGQVAPRSALARAYVGLNQQLHEWCDVEPEGVGGKRGGALGRAVRGLFRRS